MFTDTLRSIARSTHDDALADELRDLLRGGRSPAEADILELVEDFSGSDPDACKELEEALELR